MNTITLIANTAADVEVRSIGSNGTPLAEFDVAVNHRFKVDGQQREETTWVRIKAWNGLSKVAAYLRKGEKVGVTGELRQDEWTDRETGKARRMHYVRAEKIELLGRRAANASPATQDAAPSSQDVPDYAGAEDDDIPF